MTDEKKPATEADTWKKEIEAAKERLEKFHTQGEKINKKFLGRPATDESKVNNDLNLFHSNIITLQSLLFGSTPKVDVARRYFDPDDDAARVASLIFSRILNTSIEAPSASFSTVIRSALQDRLIPGLGAARVRYTVDTEEEEIDAVFDPDGYETAEAYTKSTMLGEDCEIEYVYWKDFIWGWGRNWDTVGWVAFRTHPTKADIKARFGEEAAEKITYETRNKDEEEKEESKEMDDPKQRAEIYEIWCKDTKKVKWYSERDNHMLETKDDPLGLDGFFPCPTPMIANATTTMFIPRADYMLTQDLYKEIDNLESRIVSITQAIKVVGAYDKNSTELGGILNDALENQMVPVESWNSFSEKGGFAGSMDWMPIDTMVATVNELRNLRDENISLLYQITGMSDILRGQSTESGVSATEQGLKAKFGSVRVQALQDGFANFATELQQLRAEVIAKHFSDETILEMANMNNSMEEVPAIVSGMKLLRSPLREWRVQIRPESVAMVDYGQLRNERTEYMTALSTYLQSSQAMIKQVPASGPMLLRLMQWGLSGFKGSNEIEGVVDQAIEKAEEAIKKQQQAPKDETPSPEEQKAKLEQAKMQAKMQELQTKHKQEMEKMMQDFKLDMQVIQATTQGKLQEQQAQLEGDLIVAEVETVNALKVEEAKQDGMEQRSSKET